MEFYFQNSFLEINPIGRRILLTIKEAFNLVLIITSFFLLFSGIFWLRPLALLIILICLTLFLRSSAQEDVRRFYHHQTKINLNDYLDKKTRNFLIAVLTRAEILKPTNFYFFLLKEFLRKKEIRNLFGRLNIDFENFNYTVDFAKTNQDFQKLILPILISAFNLAKSLNFPSINIYFLFFGLYQNADPELGKIFESSDLKKDYLLSGILMELFRIHSFGLRSLFQPLAVFQRKISDRALLNKALTSKETYFLNAYSVDFTYLANKENAGYLIGHRQELESLIENLRQGNNVLLIGQEGTGKEAIILHLAWLIQNESVPPELLDFRLVKLDLSLIYSQNKEKFLEIMSKIIDDVRDSGYIILYFPYFEEIILEKDVDIFHILGEVLRSRDIPIIATMTPEGYQRSLTKVNLDSFFEKIEIQELSEEESIFLLTLKSILWEKKEKIIISPQSVATAVFLAKRFIKEKPLPQSAEDVIIDGLSLARKLKSKYLTKEAVQEIVAEKKKIPVKEIDIEEKEKLLNLENLLHQRIVNQNEAIKEIARVLKIYRAGLEKKKGPIGVFLFVGPTGVGKTETAKALAKIYYGSEKSMVRLDMVEFQNPEDIDKLIGTKDGQILGRLTEPIRQNPYSLILLDEFEKTHPTILRIFLPIFDEGIIKDALGREVDFTNSLIICTSNAYSEDVKQGIENGLEFDKIVDSLKSKLSQIFSVELLNRFDQVIVYKPLDEENLLKIAEIMIKDLQAEILLKHGIDLIVSSPALKEIVRLGTDPVYGARPLQRKIDEIIRSEIANLILANKLSRGNKIIVNFDQNFEFKIE